MGVILNSRVQSILRLYRSASPRVLDIGKRWYRANAERLIDSIVEASNFTLSRPACAAIFSILSPRMDAMSNTRLAFQVAHCAVDRLDPCRVRGILHRALPDLRAVLSGSDPWTVFRSTAPKTRAFFFNLLGDLSHVTVDVWAARAVRWNRPITRRAYAAISDSYVDASCILGDEPASVQAVVWVQSRGASGVISHQRTLEGFDMPRLVV